MKECYWYDAKTDTCELRRRLCSGDVAEIDRFELANERARLDETSCPCRCAPAVPPGAVEPRHRARFQRFLT